MDEACVSEVLLLAVKSLSVLSPKHVLLPSELAVLYALILAAAANEKNQAILFKAVARRSFGEIDTVASESENARRRR